MRHRSFLVVFVAVSACASHQRAILGQPWPPSGCSPLHGGFPGTRPSPVITAQGKGSDEGLIARGRGRLIVRVYSAADTAPVLDAHVLGVVQAPGRFGAFTNAAGFATLELPSGRHAVSVRRIGFAAWKDSLDVRLGRIDSVFIGLGVAPVCLT